MTAHNLEDNLETYVMRKKRGNSSLGLSAIPKINIVDNLRIIRPLLSYNKKSLEATCRSYEVKWITDKSNFNEKFERVRIRNYLRSKPPSLIKKISSEFNKKKQKNLALEKQISVFFSKRVNIL